VEEVVVQRDLTGVLVAVAACHLVQEQVAVLHNTAHTSYSLKRNGTYTWYSASSWNTTSEALKYDTCSQGISQFYLHTHSPHVHPQLEWAIPAFAFPDGTHSLTVDGWKAELDCVAGYVGRQFTCLKAVTHPTTNRAQCSATALMETNALPLH